MSAAFTKLYSLLLRRFLKIAKESLNLKFSILRKSKHLNKSPR